MTRTLTRNILPFLLTAAAVLTCTWFVVQSEAFAQRPDLMAFASTVDLTLIIPGLYFLFIRKTKIPKITLIPVFVLSLLAAYNIIPEENHTTLDYLQMALPLVELVVIGFVVWNIRKTFIAYKKQKKSVRRQGFIETVHEAASKAYGQGVLANVLATEVSMFHYAIIGWNPMKEAPKGPQYTYHKDNGYVAFFAVALFAVVIETAILHLLLMQWSNTAAWILTGLSIYSLFFVIGDFNAIRKRPIYLDEAVLKLRVGFRWRMDIPFHMIESIELRTPDKEKEEFANLILAGEPNVAIRFKEEMTAEGLYGLKKKFDLLAIHIDDKLAFKAALEEKMA